MPLTRDQILSADDIRIVPVRVPEWGGEVCVRSISAAERDRLEQDMLKARTDGGIDNLRAMLVSMAACDAEGKRLFAQADVAALGAKSATAMDRVFTEAQRLSGLGASDVEGMEKN